MSGAVGEEDGGGSGGGLGDGVFLVAANISSSTAGSDRKIKPAIKYSNSKPLLTDTSDGSSGQNISNSYDDNGFQSVYLVTAVW